MARTIPISYGEFYDWPRMIRFQVGGQWFFMQSAFDEEQDDYPDFYEVYLLPFHSEEEIKSHPHYWMELDKASYLGRIPVLQAGLDETRRQSLDASVIEPWLSARMQAVQ